MGIHSPDQAQGFPEPPVERSPRWRRIWAVRPLLLTVARRHGADAHEAEDVVQDAMLRAAEHPEIGNDRLQAWMVAVTRRLCMDGHRRRSSETRRWARASGQAVVQQPGQHVEEQVCDRFEAIWAASLVAKLLPPRQAEALHLTAAGYDVQQVAGELGVNYRAAESLLARARRTLRAALTAGAGAVAWSCRGPSITASNSASLALASAAVVAGVAIATAPIVLFPEELPGTRWGPVLPESHGRPPASSIPRNHPAPEATAPEATAAPGGVDNSIPEPRPAPPHAVLPAPRLALGELASSTPARPPLSPPVLPPAPLPLPPIEEQAPLSAAPSPAPVVVPPRAVLPPPLRTPVPSP